MDLTELKANEEILAQTLLPNEPDPTEALGSKDAFLTRAYLMLSCALIEEFLEASLEHYLARMADHQGKGAVACFAYLSMWFADDFKGQLKSVRSEEDVVKLLGALYARKVLKSNNGMQRRDILSMVSPLGLRAAIEDGCDDLLGLSDTLGSRRGEMAHRFRIEEELRPTPAKQMVHDVLDHLPDLMKILDWPEAFVAPGMPATAEPAVAGLIDVQTEDATAL